MQESCAWSSSVRVAGRLSSHRVIWRVYRDHRGGGRRGGHRAERPHVALHGLHAAVPAPGLQLGVQDSRVGDPFVPPLAQVRLVPAGLGRAAGGLDQQLVGAGGGGEPVHGVLAQAQDPGGRPLGVPGGEQAVDGGVAVAGAGHQAPFPAADIS